MNHSSRLNRAMEASSETDLAATKRVACTQGALTGSLRTLAHEDNDASVNQLETNTVLLPTSQWLG